jgi:hypothetical protein
MEKYDPYHQAHLVLACIRLLEYRHQVPPTVDAICKELAISSEKGHILCRKLEELGAAKMVKQGGDTRLFIKDHLQVEELKTEADASGMKEELEKFKDGQDKFRQKVESIAAQQEKKQKDLFAELEAKLKGKMDKT